MRFRVTWRLPTFSEWMRMMALALVALAGRMSLRDDYWWIVPLVVGSMIADFYWKKSSDHD